MRTRACALKLAHSKDGVSETQDGVLRAVTCLVIDFLGLSELYRTSITIDSISHGNFLVRPSKLLSFGLQERTIWPLSQVVDAVYRVLRQT